MLFGASIAYPQPALISSSVLEGPCGAKTRTLPGAAPPGAAPPGDGAPLLPGNPRPLPKPNPPIITNTGTLSLASFGVVRVREIFTSIDGHCALSTCPSSRFSTQGRSATVVSRVSRTDQVTFGTFAG